MPIHRGPARLRETLGESERVQRWLQWLNMIVHHRLPAVGSSARFTAASTVDSPSMHTETTAPPAAYGDIPLPIDGSLIDGGFVNPVLTACDVTDYGHVKYVADPFLLLGPSTWHLYFEVFNPDRTPSAVISRATSVDQGSTWRYDQVVLDAGVHASFPFVFRYDGCTWMLPNLDPPNETGTVPLYRSTDGGRRFERVATLASPQNSPTDRVVFRWKRRWWLFVSIAADERELRVYHNERLAADGWTAHDCNPVCVDKARIPGGRPIVVGDRLLCFFQNGKHYYGERVETVEIETLTPTEYVETEIGGGPVAVPTGRAIGWNSARMHTFDPWYTGDRWVCAVDGDTALGSSLVGPQWSIGLCVVTPY